MVPNGRLKVLWVDDDWASRQRSFLLDQLRNLLTTLLDEREVMLQLETKADGAILDTIVAGQFDLVILDHMLDENGSSIQLPRFSTDVIARMGRMKLSVPVVVVTEHERDQFAPHLPSLQNQVHAIFGKSDEGIRDLADFIAGFAESPPVNLVVLSDLHAGFLAERDPLAWPSFRDTLIRDMEMCGQEIRPDFLMVSGDLAWRRQEVDLIEASTTLSRMQTALGLPGTAVYFCPGNHDVNFEKQSEPWADYEGFVRRSAALSPDVLARHYAFNTRMLALDRFTDRKSALAVATDAKKAVLVACLNSCRVEVTHEAGIRKSVVIPEIGTEQWDALEQIVSREANSRLKIAMFHHPLFAAPGGDWEDERALHDQGRALHRLAKLGFSLVIHGHAHFSALHEHTFTVINRTGGQRAPAKLLILSCSTAGAEPNSGAPFRQYYWVQIGHKAGSDGKRPVTIRSRVYSSVEYTWSDGGEIAAGSYFI